MAYPKRRTWFSIWNVLFFVWFFSGLLIIIYWRILYPDKLRLNLLLSPMVTYVSKEGIYSIVYPSMWVVSETPQGDHGDMDVIGTIGSPGSSMPRLTLASHAFDKPTIENVVQWGGDRAKRWQEFQFKGQQEYLIAGRPGMRLEYICSRNINFLSGKYALSKCYDYYFVEGTTGYALSFCARVDQWDDVWPVFEKMVNSFSLK
jgi:hypothetical protein